ncbi:MAG: CAP domain-containing protein [Rhizomicrobium sp.]
MRVVRQTAAQAGIVLLALLLCVACADETAAPEMSAPPPDPRTQMAALETRIFDLIQNERHKIDPKAKVLALDTELTGVARKRSEDMAAKNYMAHAGPDGQTSASLIMDQDQDFQGLLGENIAAEHYAPAYGVNVETYAQAFVKTWLDSPDHKENLSYAPYDRSGVGAAVSGDTVYVTQLFATDLGLPKHSPDPKARMVTKLQHPEAGPPPVVPEPRPATDISP